MFQFARVRAVYWPHLLIKLKQYQKKFLIYNDFDSKKSPHSPRNSFDVSKGVKRDADFQKKS